MPVMDPLYKSHPLYKYRRILLINVVVSFIFGSVALAWSTYSAGLWVFHLVFIAISGFTSFYDLYKWASQKKTDPEHDPKWPLKFVIVLDLLLAAVLLWIYLGELTVSDTAYYYRDSGTFAKAYASLTALVAALLHGYCFWRQIMTIKKRQWLAKLPASLRACANCGSSVEGLAEDPSPSSTSTHSSTLTPALVPEACTSRAAAQDPDIEATAGLSVPSSSTRSTCLITPITDDEDEALSDSLLIETNGGYGTMRSASAKGELSIPYKDEEVTVVRKKKAGKKKVPRTQGRHKSDDRILASFA